MKLYSLFVEKIFNPLSLRQRRHKMNQFFQLLEPLQSDMVLDVGVSNKEYRSSDNLFSKEYPYPDRVVALGIGNLRDFKERFSKIRVVAYDGQRFPFKDGVFGLTFCNAVVEHVGDYDMQKKNYPGMSPCWQGNLYNYT